MSFPGGSVGKNPPAKARDTRLGPWVGKMPWRRKRQPTPIFLPGESHGQRSLADYIVHEVTKSQTRLKRLSTHTKENGATEDAMVGWHHQLNGHESEQTLGDSNEGQQPGVLQSIGQQGVRHD